MADDLAPASYDDVRITLAMALTRGDRKLRLQAAEVMAAVVAERLVQALEQGGYVIMQKRPVASSAAPLGRGWKPPSGQGS